MNTRHIPSIGEILHGMTCPPLPLTPDEITARRIRLEGALRDEGLSEANVSRLATDETAARMIEHERDTLNRIREIFDQQNYTQRDKLRDQWSEGRQI